MTLVPKLFCVCITILLIMPWMLTTLLEFTRRMFVHNLFGYVYGAVVSKTDNKQMPLYLPSGSAPPIVLKE